MLLEITGSHVSIHNSPIGEISLVSPSTSYVHNARRWMAAIFYISTTEQRPQKLTTITRTTHAPPRDNTGAPRTYVTGIVPVMVYTTKIWSKGGGVIWSSLGRGVETVVSAHLLAAGFLCSRHTFCVVCVH